MINTNDVRNQSRIDHKPIGNTGTQQIHRTRIQLTFRSSKENKDCQYVANIAKDKQYRKTIASDIFLRHGNFRNRHDVQKLVQLKVNSIYTFSFILTMHLCNNYRGEVRFRILIEEIFFQNLIMFSIQNHSIIYQIL